MMFRIRLLLFPLAIACFAAKPTDYSTDIVVLDGGQVVQRMKLYVSGQRSRMEGMTAGPLGRMVAITRQDRGVSWTLFPERRQYSETPLTGHQPGKIDLANFDLIATRKEVLGRETVLGLPCTKFRATVGKLPNGQPLVATAWVSDSLQLPLRLETMGIIQENRNLTLGPQPAHLFEIPAGFARTSGRTMPFSGVPGQGGQVGGGGMPATGTLAGAGGPAWKLNTNLAGGDYRVIDMATSNPTACKAACDNEVRCKSWTLVKPEAPGGMGYCFLKDMVPEANTEGCCISGLKGAGGSVGGSVGGLVSTHQVEMNINRGGEDYRDFIPTRASALLCAEACAKDARCKAWTWVKNVVEPPTGHCWLKTPAPEPAQDECCISGLKR